MPGTDMNLENFCSHFLSSGIHNSVIVKSPEGKGTFQLLLYLFFFLQHSSSRVFIHPQYLVRKNVRPYLICLRINAI